MTEKPKKKAGRPKGSGKGVPMSQEHRDKIRNSNVLSRLIKHAEGKEPDMAGTEVQAASTLLSFAFPKLQATQVSGDAENPVKLIVTIGGD